MLYFTVSLNKFSYTYIRNKMLLPKCFYSCCNNIVVMTVGAFTHYGHNETLKSGVISGVTTKWVKEKMAQRGRWVRWEWRWPSDVSSPACVARSPGCCLSSPGAAPGPWSCAAVQAWQALLQKGFSQADGVPPVSCVAGGVSCSAASAHSPAPVKTLLEPLGLRHGQGARWPWLHTDCACVSETPGASRSHQDHAQQRVPQTFNISMGIVCF